MGEAILQGRGYANVKRMRQAGATVITTARSKPKALPLLPEGASIIPGLSGFKS
jgi:hypothetical protein